MKKTEYITYRTDANIKSILSQIAAEKKWSISQLSEEIIKEWLQEKYPELLPQEYWAIADRDGLPTAVCDYIAGMTDRYAVMVFQQLTIPKNWSKY